MAPTTAWTLAYRVLQAAFLLTAALNLLHIRAGFLTNYLADLTVPALLYVLSRGLVPSKPRRFPFLFLPMRWLGRTPERAACFFFLASTATEASQIYWPRGFFAGRYDPWDVVAYGVGLLVCYSFDKLQRARPAAADALAFVQDEPDRAGFELLRKPPARSPAMRA